MLNPWLILFALLLLCFDSSAETAPIPKSKTETLESIKQRIGDEVSEKQALQKQIDSINTDLSKTKGKLVETANTIQQYEDNLKSLENRIAELEAKKTELERDLESDRASISKLILALERIRRTPPEAMIARPDSPYKTAQSALLMGNIIPSLNRHAEKLNKNLETLNRVTSELEQEKTDVLKNTENLKEEHEQLAKLMKERETLYRKTNSDLKAHENSIQQISIQAKTLEDLVAKLKEEERKEEERKSATLLRKKPDYKIPPPGEARLPISGIIRVGYHQEDDFGAKSKGLTIEGRAGSLVIAPMTGKIEFAGSFKRYGNIVIIEHANTYYSLIAGLDTITSVVGDIVKSGEPIGILPNSSLIPRPTLYYELRKNGQAVNPSVKFPDLG